MFIKSILTFIILIFLFNYSQSTICRDGSYCPGLSTCCLTPTGVGCCPYQNAVCCGDGYHCCPYGFICGQGICYRSDDTLNMGDLPIIPAEITKDNRK